MAFLSMICQDLALGVNRLTIDLVPEGSIRLLIDIQVGQLSPDVELKSLVELRNLFIYFSDR